jgi:Restriction alleviation protein Lar
MNVAGEIKDCPFCGSPEPHERIVGAGYQIVCPNCRIHTEAASRRDAIATWNTRADDGKAPAKEASAEGEARSEPIPLSQGEVNE